MLKRPAAAREMLLPRHHFVKVVQGLARGATMGHNLVDRTLQSKTELATLTISCKSHGRASSRRKERALGPLVLAEAATSCRCAHPLTLQTSV